MDVKYKNDGSVEVLISGTIGDEITVPDIQGLSKSFDSASGIKLLINSGGGYITDGWAMFNILSSFKQKIDVEVIGLAASMASVLALCGKSLTMRAGSYFMIHNPWSLVIGDANSMRHEADILDKMKDDIISLYLSKTALLKDELVALLDAETWLSAQEAVDYGFAQKIETEFAPAAASIGKMKFLHAPEGITGKYDDGLNPDPVVPERQVASIPITKTNDKENLKMTDEEKLALKNEMEKELAEKITADVMAKIPAGRTLEQQEQGDTKKDKWFFDYLFSKGKIEPAKNVTIKTTDGYGVPVLIDSQVYKRRSLGSIMRKVIAGVSDARVKNLSADIKVTVKVNPSAAIIAEGADYVDGTDKGSTVTSDVIKMGSIYSVTEELAEDTLIDFVADFADDAGKALAKLENQYFFTGTGIDQPQGIIPGGTLAVTTASPTAITYSELVDLDESIPAEYEAGAVFFMAKTTRAALRKIVDTTGRPVLQEFADGMLTLFGKPLVPTPNMAAFGAGNTVICLANRGAYGIFDRTSGLKTRITENTKNGDTEVRWALRTDGRVLDATAFQLLAMHI